MAGSFRSVAKDVLIYGSGDLLVRATGFLTLPIYTRILTPEDYGVWSFVTTATVLLSAFLALGGDSAYARFFFEAKTLEDRQRVTSTWLAFLAAWSFGLTLVILPLSAPFSDWAFGTREHGLLFVLALLSAPFTLMNTMFGQVLRNQFRPGLFALLGISTALLGVVLSVFGAVVLDWGLRGIVGGLLLALVVMLPIRMWTARDCLRLVFSRPLLRRLLAFGVPLVPTSLAWWIFGMSDRILVGKLSTLDQLGLYSVALSLASVLSISVGALGQAWSPHAFRIYEEDESHASAFYGRMLTYILVGLGLLAVGLSTFARDLLSILATPKFVPAAEAVAPLALALVAYGSVQVTAMGISLTKKTLYLAIYAWIGAALNVSLNLLLVPRFGMLGAAWATFASYVFLTAAYLVTSQRLWVVAYEKRRAAVVITLTLAFTVPAPYLPQMGLPADLALGGAYCLAFLASIVVLHGIDRQDWRSLVLILRRGHVARVEGSA